MHSNPFIWSALLVVLSSGCGGGCGGCAGADGYTYPSRASVDTVPVADAMKLRITRDGLDFFRQAIPPLLDQALADQGAAQGQITVPVPGTGPRGVCQGAQMHRKKTLNGCLNMAMVV